MNLWEEAMKKLSLEDLDKDEILAALGLAKKKDWLEATLPAAGVFVAGLAIGAVAALLLAPKTGAEMREDLGDRVRRRRAAGMGANPEEDTGI